MDLSRDYVNAALSSKLIQDNWLPGMYDMVYNPKKDEIFYLSWDDYLKVKNNPELKKSVLFIPQEGNMNAIYHAIKEPEFPHIATERCVELDLEFNERWERLAKEESKKYANFERILKTKERQQLYFLMKYYEKKEFPGIVLLSNN